jgi:ABC-type glutathione transport system ATPase component
MYGLQGMIAFVTSMSEYLLKKGKHRLITIFRFKYSGLLYPYFRHSYRVFSVFLRKDVRELSGGEAIRLILCQLFLGRYNVLVLDEPTNFLDVDCMEALEKFLEAYQGTVLLVSHDRRFIERVADSVYAIEDHQLELKKGSKS